MKFILCFLLVGMLSAQVFIPPIPKKKATASVGDGGRFAVGSYTGNGADDRGITGIGFQPDVVVIKGAGATAATIRTSTMTGDSTSNLGVSASLLVTNRIQSLDADGFTIGTDAQVNTNTTVYHWQAWKQGTSSVKVGKYWGTGVGKNITGIGFQPDLVVLVANSSNANTFQLWKPSSLGGDTVVTFTIYEDNVGNITGFIADGFSVGTDWGANSNGIEYYYVAFKKVDGYAWGDKYVGNAGADRDIIGSTSTPNLWWASPIGNFENRVFHSSSEADTYSFFFTADAEKTNNIFDKFNADGFRVDSGILNQNSVMNHYFLWKVR